MIKRMGEPKKNGGKLSPMARKNSGKVIPIARKKGGNVKLEERHRRRLSLIGY